MSVESKIPIIIVTSNSGKLEQARRELSSINQATIYGLPPSFDEDKIKKSIPKEFQSSFEYPLLISRGKFESLRDKGEEGLIVVSDSVAAVRDGEQWFILNRDDPKERRDQFSEWVQKNGVIRFIGAVNFGLLPDKQPISILSFCEIPISSEKLATLSLPVSIDELERLKDPARPIRIGYLDHSFNETNVRETNNFDSGTSEEIRARPFISGLTRDVLSIASLIAETQLKLEPILKEFIATYPFNTISYYASTIGFDSERIKEFYKEILTNDFFYKNGGNCSLHTIFLARRLEGLGYTSNVVIFPSKNPDKDNGHSGIAINKDGMIFLLDPGLSLPYILPFSPNIPLFYNFYYGDNKKIFLLRSDSPGGFSMLVESKKGRVEFPAINFLSINEFLKLAPQILFDLHDKRKIVKIDFHDEHGKKLLRISLDLTTREILINNEVFKLDEVSDKIDNLNIPKNLKDQLINLLASL